MQENRSIGKVILRGLPMILVTMISSWYIVRNHEGAMFFLIIEFLILYFFYFLWEYYFAKILK
ncbi:hypothetical protein Hbal_1644 [Hirschia baltica ATCC 49814]|uniref:DUF2061 domain-containing protein n=1 Tax=Hirschia baltica (strain ATCC 49814 / DSM 5838 / IFAM 1418) TaxID=582402 RepID=C6XJN7_HIRBI|nr:hypothetical protein Hbal_1644 [Hirschia baltica ATCC 49814]